MTDLDELRAELDELAQPEKKGGRSPREERIIAGFEEIQRFVEQHGRTPQHGEDRDIFERLYAVRLDRIRALEECQSLLASFDHQELLSSPNTVSTKQVESMDDDELLAELEGASGSTGITELRHVRSSADKRAAEEIANREKCEDFDRFQPLFKQVESELKTGVRITRPFGRDASITAGNFFILGGQLVYVATKGEDF
ncbi:MAG: GIY-YIG nuclease family protein, partial [Limisphaerales bacterium]